MAGEITYTSFRKTVNQTSNYYGNPYLSAGGGGSSTPVSGDYLLKTGDNATGSYTFDGNTFKINSTTHRVGIGISGSPNYLLDVGGDGNFSGTVYAANIGIGTTTPYEKLEVAGAISATGNVLANNLQGPALTMYYNTGNDYGVLQAVDWGVAYKDIVLQLNGGNVGIGIAPTSNYRFRVSGASYFSAYVYTAGHAGTPDFSSGFAGSGWKIDYSGGDTTLTVDNLIIRKALTAYELNINRINSVNGGLVVSVANGKSILVAGTTIYFDEDNGSKQIQFVVNDYIRAQIWTGRGIASYVGLVTAVNHSNTYGTANIVATTISGTPWNEMELVQIGNTSDTARQNLIYITASDTNNPYIDMLAGVNDGNFSGKQKLRIGNLTGITDSDFGGALSGYGLYADNVYLKGKIIIAAGTTGYANITDKPTIPTNTNQLTDGANLGGTATWSGVTGTGKPADNATVGATWGTNLSGIPTPLTTPTGTGLFLSATYLGFYTSSAWKVYIDNAGNFSLGDAVNNNTGLYWSQSEATLKIVGEINATTGRIGGWYIGTSTLYSASSGTRIVLDSTNAAITAHGSSSDVYLKIDATSDSSSPFLNIIGGDYLCKLNYSAINLDSQSSARFYASTYGGTQLELLTKGLPTTTDDAYYTLMVNSSTGQVYRMQNSLIRAYYSSSYYFKAVASSSVLTVYMKGLKTWPSNDTGDSNPDHFYPLRVHYTSGEVIMFS